MTKKESISLCKLSLYLKTVLLCVLIQILQGSCNIEVCNVALKKVKFARISMNTDELAQKHDASQPNASEVECRLVNSKTNWHTFSPYDVSSDCLTYPQTIWSILRINCDYFYSVCTQLRTQLYTLSHTQRSLVLIPSTCPHSPLYLSVLTDLHFKSNPTIESRVIACCIAWSVTGGRSWIPR